MKKPYLISVIGPTAIGKTALSIRLAQHFQTEIISADSRQFYKEMCIGTAVPEPDELAAAPHHFIQNRSIFDNYSVGDFERDALRLLNEKFKTRPVMVMVGGSGLYVDAVLKGLDDFPDINPEIRQSLQHDLKNEGLEKLQQKLKTLDPVSYAQIDVQNPQRLIRALEICLGTGKPYSSFLSGKNRKRNFTAIKIGLTAEREIIYDRINRRVDQMLADGLLQEAEKLYPYRDKNALQTVGYKELFRYIGGEWDLDFAVSEIKKNTRRFAKRQLTWYRKDPEILWFDYRNDAKKIIAAIVKKITE